MRTSNSTINIKFLEEIFPSRLAITAKNDGSFRKCCSQSLAPKALPDTSG
jgi:hypothetical protein